MNVRRERRYVITASRLTRTGTYGSGSVTPDLERVTPDLAQHI